MLLSLKSALKIYLDICDWFESLNLLFTALWSGPALDCDSMLMHSFMSFTVFMTNMFILTCVAVMFLHQGFYGCVCLWPHVVCSCCKNAKCIQLSTQYIECMTIKKKKKKPQFNTWAIDRKEKQASLWASVSGRLMKPRRSHHCVKGSFCLLCDTTTHPENDCHPLIDLMAKWSAWLVLHRSEASRCTLWHFLPYFILCFCISSSLYLSLRLFPTSPPNTPKTP